VREGSANLFITLHKERARTSQEFEEDLTPQLTKIADARVTFQANGPGGGGSGRDVSVMLSGSDPKKLDETAATLVEQMKTLPELRAPRISADLQRPELLITPRTDLAAQLGVTTVALSQTIRIATLGVIDQNRAKFSLSHPQIPVRAISLQRFKLNPSTSTPARSWEAAQPPACGHVRVESPMPRLRVLFRSHLKPTQTSVFVSPLLAAMKMQAVAICRALQRKTSRSHSIKVSLLRA